MPRPSLPLPEHGFSYQRRDGLLLVTPAPTGKMNRSDWSDAQLPWRSVIVSERTGEVLSAGFPKFFNYGESGRQDAGVSPEASRLNRALEDGEPVWFTEKYDGSLCIRSVIDGEVIFRTRGTVDFDTPHTRAMRACAAACYPALLDPELACDRSLLFEFVSPQFRIVVGYEHADLVLVGAVTHDDFSLADMPELQTLAAVHNLRLVDLMTLPTGVPQLLVAVGDMEGKEGMVARCEHGQTLVKVKTAQYLARHRLRFALTARVVRETCIARDVRSPGDFERYLQECGGDWELAADARPLVDCYLRACAHARETLASLTGQVKAAQQRFPDRGEFAREFALALGGASTHAAFRLLQGRAEQAFVLLRTEALQREYAALELADEQRAATLTVTYTPSV